MRHQSEEIKKKDNTPRGVSNEFFSKRDLEYKCCRTGTVKTSPKILHTVVITGTEEI